MIVINISRNKLISFIFIVLFIDNINNIKFDNWIYFILSKENNKHIDKSRNKFNSNNRSLKVILTIKYNSVNF